MKEQMTSEERKRAREAMVEDGLYEPPREFWERRESESTQPPSRGLGNFL